MTQEPLNIDPGQVRVHGGIISDAAREADRSLAASREAAAAARAGFPGAAAGPFEVMLVALEASDTALVEAIDRAVAGTALRRTTTTSMGLHYAETLREWDRRFAARHDEVRALGFDEVFLRMWRFYLTYCEAGFRAGYLDVAQLTMEKTR